MVNPDDLSRDGIWAREQAQILAQLIRVILSTGMFISGILGFVLDNTVPGNFNLPLLKNFKITKMILGPPSKY